MFDYKRNYRDIITHPDFKDEEILIFTVGREVSPFYFNPKNSPPGVEEHVWKKKLCSIIEKAYFLGYGAMDIIMDSFDAKVMIAVKPSRKFSGTYLIFGKVSRKRSSERIPGHIEQSAYTFEEFENDFVSMVKSIR